MSDFKLLRQVIINHLLPFLLMILSGILCIGCSVITFRFISGFGRYLFSSVFGMIGLGIGYLAISTNISSCRYYYERAVLKKYGVKTQAKLVAKADESSGEGEPNFVLDYVYIWQGKEYRGRGSIENQQIFEALEPGVEIPIIIVSKKPSSSMVETGKIKWQYQIRNEKQTMEPAFQDDLQALDVKLTAKGIDIK